MAVTAEDRETQALSTLYETDEKESMINTLYSSQLLIEFFAGCLHLFLP